jgi:tRNA 2-thiouridine synthesizing protein A
VVSDSPPKELDARGLRCPEPVMLLHKAIAEIESGDRLRVLATDPTTERDIPQFCRFLGHELVSQDSDGSEWVYVLRKGE